MTDEKIPTTLDISKVYADPQVQCREKLDRATVKDYAERMLGGNTFPPIVTFHDGTLYRLVDGFHRHQAALEAGKTVISAIVHEGGAREALLFAAGANTRHGLRRTNADKRKAVSMLLMDKEWKTWTDHRIAEHCGVSQPMVSALKKELAENGYQFPSRRKCKNGKTMETNNIGKPSVEPAAPMSGTEEPEEADEIERLRARVSELEREIEDKDRRIAELEHALAQARPFWPPVIAQEGATETRAAGN
ncbi:MAG: ParB/RepB/Spo0J family partition protein [Proteobacteria bacterium]|nr:ParB/RepB/Spo0J family partition protein [Pseudomonadota bacterium]